MHNLTGEIITLMIMACALGMDAFSIGLGMGMFRMRLRQIFLIGLTVGFFHIWMPLLGIICGRFLSEQFGTFAAYAGGILLVLLGIQMFISGIRGEEGTTFAPVGKGLWLFALSVSLDSFSVGLTLGIYGAKTIIIVSFGLAAMILSWSGLLIGKKIQGLLGVYSEIFGGSILLIFGLKLLLLH